MAIYNMEDYLEEAILSVIHQDIGFEKNVQLILVNDGSFDKSDVICKKYRDLYTDNIIYIKKQNGGVSNARNEGIKFTNGKYINFLDADDKLEKHVLTKVYEFFAKVYNVVDIVSIPIEFFEGKTGEHILNYKYIKGTRIIDLTEEYASIQLSASSSFFKGNLKDKIKFEENMQYAEDAYIINKILLKTNKLGVVSECKYLYRFRKKLSSAIQTGNMKKEWYLNYITTFSLNLIKYCKYINYKIPTFIQYTIMYDLQWRVNSLKTINSVLNKKEIEKFFLEFIYIIKNIDFKIIWKQKNIRVHRKFILLIIKVNKLKLIRNMLINILIRI
nr:glycosyltransferase [Clostridium botulinum]